MGEVWPWWAGALALGAVSGTFSVVFGRPLGMSGSLRAVIYGRETRAQDRARDAMAAPDAEAALMAATLAAFSAEDLEAATLMGPPAAPGPAPASAPPAPSTPLRLEEHLTVLGGTAVGAAVAVHLLGAPVQAPLAALGVPGLVLGFGGGVLVGAGAAMMGGCTSGHGLFGCGSWRLGSVVATAIFFGTACVTALAMGAWP